MTTLLEDLSQEKEDFSSLMEQQEEEREEGRLGNQGKENEVAEDKSWNSVSDSKPCELEEEKGAGSQTRLQERGNHGDNEKKKVGEACNDNDSKDDKYSTLLKLYEELQGKHRTTLGEMEILRDTIDTLREDQVETNKQLERQKEQASSFQDIEECNVELREECENYAQKLKDLQECHSDLEHTLEETNSQLHTLQIENKKLQGQLSSKDDTISKLESELCMIEKSRIDKPNGTGNNDVREAPSVEDSSNNQSSMSLAEQVEDLKDSARRSTSRLAYLNSRLTAKDEMIAKLQNRMEEVIAERDSFREALQSSFVSTEPETHISRSTSDPTIMANKPHDSDIDFAKKDSDGPAPSPSTHSTDIDFSSGKSETKSGHPSQRDEDINSQRAFASSSAMLSNWQNAAAVASVADSLKGVTSSLGSYLYAPSTSMNGISDGLSGKQKTYLTSLERKVHILQEKNKKLSELKSLIPVVEELKEKAAAAEESASETDKWAEEEFALLNKKIEELRELRKEALEKLQNSQQEVHNLNQQISRTAKAYSNFEEKLQEKSNKILSLEKKIRDLKGNTVELSVYQQVEDRVSSLMGETKHWQQKAQSLSKEMHRAMAMQTDFNKSREEISRLEKKIEELEVERLSFKQAMQDAMLGHSDMELSNSQVENKQDKSPLKTWFSSIL